MQIVLQLETHSGNMKPMNTQLASGLTSCNSECIQNVTLV